MNEQEVARITQVYNQYREDGRFQAQWSEHNPGNQAILAERRQTMAQVLQTHGLLPLTSHRILEVGCGSGNVLASLQTWGATAENLYGIDLLPDRIAAAQQKYPNLNFRCANAEQLPFPNNYFDLILVFTVFSSILDAQMSSHVAAATMRVLAPHGAILWYDFRYNNPRNPHVHGMRRHDIARLFPKLQQELTAVTLLPPLARRLGRLTPLLYPLLRIVPALRTHYLGLLRQG